MIKWMKEPIKIGQVEIHNRLVMPPMETRKASNEGYVTDKILSYYDERTQGGAIGLLVTEHTYVAPEGKAAKGQLGIYSDACVPGLKTLVELIHKNGSKVVAQLAHAGASAPAELVGAENVISASDIESPAATAKKGNAPKAMTIEDIDRVKKCFVQAALRAQEAGYDGIEIHGAHGYLLNSFYSPINNKRTDAYTGSTLEGRLRLHTEILTEIRQVVRPDFIVGIRFGAVDYGMEGGSGFDELAEATRILAATGIDLMDVSGGLNGATHGLDRNPGYFADASVIVKQNCDIPVILTGGIKDINDAETFLQEGKADMIGVGRAIYAKASWAQEAMK